MTYGIKYAGSKLKLLSQIENIIRTTNSKTVLDAFAGTTRVSQYLANRGYEVICNDISPISKIFGQCFLLNNVSQTAYKGFIDHLNNLKPIDGWFTEKYGGKISDTKKPFQVHNTRRLDAIREEIDRLTLSSIEKSTLLTSLLMGLDKVDSTLGHQSAYLKNWSARSFNDLLLEVPNYNTHVNNHKVLQQMAGSISDEIDLCYIDPPYGTNSIKMPSSRVRYDSYYHIYKTVILNDKPELFGRNNRRLDSKDNVAISTFESVDKDVVIQAFRELFNIRAKYLLFSCSTTAKLDIQTELLPLISEYCDIISLTKIDYKKHVMSSMSWINVWNNDKENFEYLILAERK